MKELFASFEKSIERLEEVLQAEKSTITRDAAVKRFEFTVELAWKCLQMFMRNQEIVCRSPKECLREAFSFGLIPDDPRWLEMLEDRNLAVHTYDEKTADKIYSRLANYFELFSLLKEKLKAHIV